MKKPLDPHMFLPLFIHLCLHYKLSATRLDYKCSTFPVKIAIFYVPSTSSCSLPSWFTSSRIINTHLCYHALGLSLLT